MATFELKGKYTDGTDWTAGTFDVPTSLKYQHNICMKTDGEYAISFQVVSNFAGKYITISQLKDLFGELVDYPASGIVLVGTAYKNVWSIKKVTNIMYIQPWEGVLSDAYTLEDYARIIQDTVVKL